MASDASAPVPESSTSSILGGGSGSDMTVGFMQVLHQIQETLTDINKTLKAQMNHVTVEGSASQSCHGNEVEGGSEGIASSPDYQDRLHNAINDLECDTILKLANEVPQQQFQQALIGVPTDGNYRRSALHVAVMGGSVKLVDTLLTKMQAYESPRFGGTPSRLRDFVYMVDGAGLAAVDMAVIIGNGTILNIFIKAGALTSFGDEEIPLSVESQEWVDERRRLLGPILNQPLGPSDSRTWIDDLGLTRGYEYCLHQVAASGFRWRFLKHVCESGNSSVLEPLLRFRDAHGRTPLHLALTGYLFLDYRDMLEHFFEPLMAHIPSLDLNVGDHMGRTVLHHAAALGLSEAVAWLAAQRQTNLNATFKSGFRSYGESQNENSNFECFCVEDVTALHLAVIHDHVEVVKALLEAPRDKSSERQLNVNAVCSRWNHANLVTPDNWTPFQLAAYMGHERMLQVLLKDDRLSEHGVKNTKVDRVQSDYSCMLALHLATLQFHPSAVKTLVDSKIIDAFVEDWHGDTALHWAAKMASGASSVKANIYDYVSIHNFEFNLPKSPRKPSDNDIITCIDILMQTGLDMQHKNKSGCIPMLSSSCSQKVQKWWLEKMAIEAQENKNSFTMAANAISVTAALVATASFVGPLQPPLGLFSDPNSTWLNGYSQVRHTSVEVFLFCDSLSFYLAIASIVFAMLPSWHIPHEGLAQEVRIAQRCVKVAVLLLFASIIFIVCAFSAASIAIVPEQKWRYKALIVISISFGAVVCSFILSLSFMRLLTLISSRSKWARKISNAANFILLWDGPSH